MIGDRSDMAVQSMRDHPSSKVLRSLVMLASAGDANAYGEIVSRFRAMAVGYAYARLNDRHLAEDVAQEAFIAAWQSLPQLREPDRFAGWLRRIVHTHCERMRRRATVPNTRLDALGELPEPGVSDSVHGRLLEQAITQLPSAQRTVLTLFYYGEHSMRAVGRFLGLSESVVKSRLHEGRRRLREVVSTMNDDDPLQPDGSGKSEFVDKVMRLIPPAMTDALWRDSPGTWGCDPADIWSMLCAALMGDVDRIKALAAKDANLVRAEYWYIQPLHFAVREGHLAAAQALLDAGADPTYIRYGHDPLPTVARDRGHHDVARVIESARAELNVAAEPHEVHEAASTGDVASLTALIRADTSLLGLGDDEGFTPLHRAVESGHLDAVEALLDQGADPDASQAGPARRRLVPPTRAASGRFGHAAR